jgi:uncharacterized repeat protein (TIGR01451 family)
MKRDMWNRMWKGTLAALIASATLVGCESGGGDGKVGQWPWREGSAPAQAQAPAPAAKAAPAPAAAPSGAAQVLYYPTGQRATSILMLERIAPSEVVVGQPFSYDVKVTNISGMTIQDVQLTEWCADTFKLDSATPAPQTGGKNELRWAIGELTPGQSKTVTVKGTATTAGSLQNCLALTYDPRSCIAINVVQPALQLAIKAPAEVLACDPIPVQYTVTNSGTGTARNVVVSHALPEGLMTDNGQKALEAKVDALAPGQSRTFTSTLKASKTGEFANAAKAAADAGLKADASAKTVVRKPKLELKAEGAQRIFIGRAASYTGTLTNSGDGDARDASLVVTLPTGASAVKAEGAQIVGSKLSWPLGTLKPGQKVNFAYSFMPAGAGNVASKVEASAYCADLVAANPATSVEGIPAVLLEVVDEKDPVEVNGVEVYTIIVTNQGSAPDTNIKITCTLEDGMTFKSASGVTAGTHANGTITFAPLPSLAAGAKAAWKVEVVAAKEGDMRFKTVMNTDQLKRTVEETEATNFYK